MTPARMVTGYVPLPSSDQPFGEKLYRRFGSMLLDAVPDAICFEHGLADCWLVQEGRLDGVEATPLGPEQRPTTSYLAVVNQKIEWLRLAALMCDDPVLAWVDYGILKYGIAASLVPPFLADAGCEKEMRATGDVFDHVGLTDQASVPVYFGDGLICARRWIDPFVQAVKDVTRREIDKTRKITFEGIYWRMAAEEAGLPLRPHKISHASDIFKYQPLHAIQ